MQWLVQYGKEASTRQQRKDEMLQSNLQVIKEQRTRRSRRRAEFQRKYVAVAVHLDATNNSKHHANKGGDENKQGGGGAMVEGVKKYESKKSNKQPYNLFTKYKLAESIEIPKYISWALAVKNVLTPHSMELKYLPYIHDDYELPEGYFEHHDDTGHLPSLEDRQKIKFLAANMLQHHEYCEQAVDILYDFCDEYICEDFRRSFIDQILPNREEFAQMDCETSLSKYAGYNRLRDRYCKKCHAYNCLLHVGPQEGCEYGREQIIENKKCIDSNLFGKRGKTLPHPKVPEVSCGNECCLHDVTAAAAKAADTKDNNQEATSVGTMGTNLSNNSNSSDMGLDTQNEWKEQCVKLGTIFEGDCCKVAKVIDLPCNVVYKYLKHKWKHEQYRLEFEQQKGSKKASSRRRPRWAKSSKNKKTKRKSMKDLDEEHENQFNKYKYKGCNCSAQCKTKACPCFAASVECDPDTCNCNGCKNNLWGLAGGCCNRHFQMQNHKRLLVAKSDVQGWGLFVRDGAKKDEFLCEYLGERIPSKEADRRGTIYDIKNYTFLFDICDKSNRTEYPTVDALYIGNKAKYINHPNDPANKNCEPRKWNVMGDPRVGLFATRDIQPYEELFFNYNFNNPEKVTWFKQLEKAEKEKAEECTKMKRARKSVAKKNCVKKNKIRHL